MKVEADVPEQHKLGVKTFVQHVHKVKADISMEAYTMENLVIVGSIGFFGIGFIDGLAKYKRHQISSMAAIWA